MDIAAEKDQITVQFGIRKLHVTQFEMKPDLQFEPEKLQTSYDVELKTNTETNSVKVLITAFYWLDRAEDRLASITVNNEFEIRNLVQFQDSKGHINIPASIVDTMVAISLSHTRVFLNNAVAGTPLSDFILPIIPMTLIRQHLEDLKA